MNLNIQAKERVRCIFCVTPWHSYDINLHFFGDSLATSLALELEKPQTSQCPINWRNRGIGGPSQGLLPQR